MSLLALKKPHQAKGRQEERSIDEKNDTGDRNWHPQI
jgi:hypothetical protein